jgi:hypothetical protein
MWLVPQGEGMPQHGSTEAPPSPTPYLTSTQHIPVFFFFSFSFYKTQQSLVGFTSSLHGWDLAIMFFFSGLVEKAGHQLHSGVGCSYSPLAAYSMSKVFGNKENRGCRMAPSSLGSPRTRNHIDCWGKAKPFPKPL